MIMDVPHADDTETDLIDLDSCKSCAKCLTLF